MYNPLTPQIAKIHQGNLVDEAIRLRKIEMFKKTPKGNRYLVRLGRLLIAAGQKLIAQYHPTAGAEFKPHQTGITGK
jgi:hypothetical protein